MKKGRKHQAKVLTYIALVIFCLAVVFMFVFSYVSKYRQSKLDIKSRYTFSITIDRNCNVVDSTETESYDSTDVYSFTGMDMAALGQIWLDEYIAQYKQAFVPSSQVVRKSGIDSAQILDASSGTVLLSFWVVPGDTDSDFFSSWEGIMDDSELKCEWVVSFYLNNNYNNTATLYVTSVMSSEEYGLEQYYANLAEDSGGDTEVTSNSNTDQLADYLIKDESLLVTYDDGERYAAVPVSYSYLLYEENSTSVLSEGSYMITTEKTAFVYGGKTVNNTKIPVTVVFSDDKGENWTTCELDNIYTADYYYVKFFDADDGVIVCGYGKSNETNESSRIYSTSNGGESWTTVGSGPATNIIKGVVYASADVGFFCYDYVDGMDSNLYMTADAGKTFAKVLLEEQKLDSSAANPDGTSSGNSSGSSGSGSSSGSSGSSSGSETSTKADTGSSESQLKWSDVYKDALTPVIDSTGLITVYLTQGSSSLYNDGKTAAKYQSSDNGTTWKYIGQVEINIEGKE